MKRSGSKSRCGRNQDRKRGGFELIICPTKRVQGRCNLQEMTSAFLEADGRCEIFLNATFGRGGEKCGLPRHLL
jgi:hypothetical protein